MSQNTQNNIAFTLMCVLAIAALVWALNVGLHKEADRMDAVADYNCAYYGYAINKHVGYEACPPTPNG